MQYVTPKDEAPILIKGEKSFIRKVSGKLLFCAGEVDMTLLVALSEIVSEQSKPTRNTILKIKQFIYYAASQEEYVLTYLAINVILAVHSYASYNSKTKSRSIVGVVYSFQTMRNFPTNDVAMLNISQIIKTVMTSASKVEMGAMFANSRKTVSKWGTISRKRLCKRTTQSHIQS